MSLPAAFLAEVQRLIPRERRFDDPLSTLAFGTDASFYRLIPKLVIRVESEREVVELLKLAGAERVPVTFRDGMKLRELTAAVKESSNVLLGAGFVLLFTVPMVRILINSGVNAAELASMPILMARYVADTVGDVYPLLAPSVGALGAFIAGSNTVSNMMLSQFQFGVAQNLGISGALIVAVQAIGAAAGNMVAIHNVVAASATVGLLGREGTTLRKTVWPTLYYVLFTGLIALFAIHVLGVSDPLVAR